MSDHEILEQLRREIAELKATLLDLTKAVTLDRTDTTAHINELYKRHAYTHNYTMNNISTLYDIALPIEAEIFPQVSQARAQFTDIVEKPKPEPSSDDDKP